jgi:NADH-quinone oxidoreductase subunit G
LSDDVPPSLFRPIGTAGNKIPRQPHRYSGRTAIFANLTVQEPKPPEDPDTPLSFSMEGLQGAPSAPLITRYWAPGWNSVQALNKFQTEVGGALRGGSPGTRLIEGLPGNQDVMFSDAPPAFTVRAGHWLAIPIHHIFGSEELSLSSAGIAELAPHPYIAINATDAADLAITDGEPVTLTMGNGSSLSLPARSEATLPRGIVGVPVGLSDMEGADVAAPSWCEVSKRRLAGAA